MARYFSFPSSVIVSYANNIATLELSMIVDDPSSISFVLRNIETGSETEIDHEEIQLLAKAADTLITLYRNNLPA